MRPLSTSPRAIKERERLAQHRAREEEHSRCLDCRMQTCNDDAPDEFYMVHDELWLQANPQDDGMLCVECLEKRIGRRLVPDDFTKFPVNELDFGWKSERLMSRLTQGRNENMTTIPNEQRARIFMQYGFAVSDPPEVEDLEDSGYALRYEIIRDIYTCQIMEAARWYTDDLVFAYNSPRDKHFPYSELEVEIYEELVDLSEETLRVLAAVLTAKVKAN